MGVALLLAPAKEAAADIFAFEEEAVAAGEEWPAGFSDRVLPEAVAVLIDSGEAADKRRAAARLLDRAGVEARNQVPVLIENIDQIAEEDRWRIGGVFVASIMEDRQRAAPIIRMAVEHEDAELRLFAVRVLSAAASIASTEIVVAFMSEILNTDPDAGVRLAALRALEEHAFDEGDSIEIFISLLDTMDDRLRYVAARGLERAGSVGARSIPYLIASLSAEDANADLRAQIWRALRSVGPDDDRVVGPETRRVARAGPNETVPGLAQRLPEGFQERAEGNAIDSAAVGRGYRYFSGRGWRGEERPLPAFPGAQGFGMWTPGGRGGEVIRVTTLADRGPGSFRAAVEAAGPRIVVFDVSGTIILESPVQIRQPYLTIAGQTAPGDGIAIAGGHTQIGTNDVIVRHLRFRPGDDSPHSAKGVNVREGDNIILDHLSTSWAKEETLSVVHSGRVTVQRSFITHGLVDAGHPKGSRGYGSLIRGAGPGNHDYAQGSYYSFINNLWAHQRSRAPRPGNYRSYEEDPIGPLFDFRNNIFYNWGGRNSGDNFDGNTKSRYNFVGNYYKPGPNSDGEYGFNEESPYSRAHWSGNSMDGDVKEDQWSLILGNTDGEYRQREPFRAGLVRTEPADLAYERVLGGSGAWPRDRYDLQVIEEVRTRTGGLIDSDREVGGHPELRPALAAVDSSGNGIPDWWQVMNGVPPEVELDPAGDMNGSGYTNIEEFLNGTEMDVFVFGGLRL